MRFDDHLCTILAAERAPGVGASSTWRQLVDLMGRGRVAADAVGLDTLRRLRAEVPVEVRAASARALGLARPDVALVELFAGDEPAVASPVLRTVTLGEGKWLALLPRLSPVARSILRRRGDLGEAVERGLQSLGAVDFTLSDHSVAAAPAVAEAKPVEAAPIEIEEPATVAEVVAPPETPLTPAPDTPRSPSSFVALGEVARTLPVVAEALRRASETQADHTPSAPAAPTVPRFEIADLVERIDRFQRDRDHAPIEAAPDADVREFRFDTDASGVIRAVEGIGRAALIGMTLARAQVQGMAQVDATVAAAVRQRARFADARLEITGTSNAAGSWRIGGVPAFDPHSGRFTGYSGTARRPLRHQTAAPAGSPVSDSLRQLVHELRTPANAVAGFAELIESQLLGPVPPIYRDRAADIRAQASDLLTAIDDLDAAARLEGGALELRIGAVPLQPLLDRIAHDLAPLATQRGAVLAVGGARAVVAADDRATERLFARLLATLLAASGPGERVGVVVGQDALGVTVAVDRPVALADLHGDTLFNLDDGGVEGGEGMPLLGAGFTLRLVRNLATELGGTLMIGADRLTLRLPAVDTQDVGRASIN